MSYNLIPTDFDLPLAFPTLTLIVVSTLFTLYVLTLMPRKENFVVNGRVRNPRDMADSESTILTIELDRGHHWRLPGHGKESCKVAGKEGRKRCDRCSRRKEARSRPRRDKGLA